jgi:polyphenol oxidase
MIGQMETLVSASRRLMDKATTGVAPGFSWVENDGWRGMAATALAPLVRHVFTTRDLAFMNDASEDWTRLGTFLGVPADDILRVKQVHGRKVVIASHSQPSRIGTEADAIVCTDPNRAIAVRVADCVPILLADRSRRLVAAIHAGWRGSCAGIVNATLETIRELGVDARDVVAAVGPSAGPCCYQVDDKVRTAFLGMTPDAVTWFSEDGPGHWTLDLWQATIDQLVDGGVPPEAISSGRYCTIDHADTCFSYRREGAGTGRMVGAVRLGIA